MATGNEPSNPKSAISLEESVTHPPHSQVEMEAELAQLMENDLLLCKTCGTQFDVHFTKGLKTCMICEDPRQYVPPEGQQWTSLSHEQGQHENFIEVDPEDERIVFITTTPKLGIGQRCILLRTERGNVLWDCISFIDEKTIRYIKSLGGLSAIVISHPHFYTTHLGWARVFGCPVYTAAEDRVWLSRADNDGRRQLLKEPTAAIIPGVTAIKTGGHFQGSMVLHWAGKLFVADSIMVVPSGMNRQNCPPGYEEALPQDNPSSGPDRTSFAFMWSYPNLIPLTPDAIHGIWRGVKPHYFQAVYGGFAGQNLKSEVDLRPRLLESMKTVTRAMGHTGYVLAEE